MRVTRREDAERLARHINGDLVELVQFFERGGRDADVRQVVQVRDAWAAAYINLFPSHKPSFKQREGV